MIGDKILIEEKCKELNFKLVDSNFDYDENMDAVFEVMCLNCGKKSTKTFVTLVKKGSKCKFCYKRTRDYKNSLSEIMPKIYKACEKNNFNFIGFVGGKWNGCRKTKLIVKCKNCGLITDKNYDNLVNKNSKCICNRVNKAKEKNILNVEDVNSVIKKCCENGNFEFISFNNKENKYYNNRTKLKFRCKKCNEIIYRSFNKIRDGYIVCDRCNDFLLEKKVKNKLIERNIIFEQQKKFEWLKYKKLMSLDFYLPEYNIAIECQGIQHFKPIEYFGGEKSFEEQKNRDLIKKELCEKHNIKVFYFNINDDINKFEIL
jgi:hypothetical protein